MLLLRSLILTLFVGFSAQASSNSLEQNVFDLSVGVKTLLLQYYHVQADEGNQQLLKELNSNLSRIDEQQQNVSQQLLSIQLTGENCPLARSSSPIFSSSPIMALDASRIMATTCNSGKSFTSIS